MNRSGSLPTDNLGHPSLLTWRTISNAMGGLTVCEFPASLPFVVYRAYWIYDIPCGAKRGGHAHREIQEILVPVCGGLTARLYSPTRQECEFRLDRPDTGIYLPPGWWRNFDDYQENTVCMVLSSGPYDENEYLREEADFFVT